MKKHCYFIVLLLLPITAAFPQFENASFDLVLQGGFSTPGNVPFWLRSNQHGSIPVDGASASLTGSARKDYCAAGTRIFDWGASIEGRLNTGHETKFILVEGYGKVKAGIFEFRAGRSKEIMGLCDTSLTSGAWAISGNALGVPKIQLGISEFYTIPWLGQLFAFRGQFAHGWLGLATLDRPWRIDLEEDTIENKTYFHQKSLYGRFGKPVWRLKLYGGFSHQVFWGNESIYYGDVYTLSPSETYLYVIVGKAYHNNDIPTNSKIGNHLGSIDLGLEYTFRQIKFLLYRQNIYDVGNLYYLANIEDGLNGISIENQNRSDNLFRWKKFVFEFLYTKNQAGEPWSPETTTPCEHYYNNGQYIDGWSYQGVGLGTPLITQRDLVREGLPAHPRDYFSNNRVRVFHIGFDGSAWQWDYRIKASWSQNYGTYYTTDEEQTTGIVNPGSVGLFGKQEQFSAFVECNRPLPKGYSIGCLTAFDTGDLLNQSFGFFLTAAKTF